MTSTRPTGIWKVAQGLLLTHPSPQTEPPATNWRTRFAEGWHEKGLRRIPLPGRLARQGRTYKLSAVGFVDTLGAKAFIEKESLLNAIAYTVTLHKAISKSRRKNPIRTTWFSDNIGASVVIEGQKPEQQKDLVVQLLRLLAAIQVLYLREFGVLCRGGVAVGPCFHDKSIIFGPALVRAYGLEQVASSPRIAVEPEIEQIAGQDVIRFFPPEGFSRPERLIGRDGTEFDKAHSIDFMHAELPQVNPKDYICKLEAAVSGGLAQLDVNDTRNRDKWEWTRQRLNALKSELGLDS